MGATKGSTFLVVDEDGRSGRFIFANGNRSKDFVTKLDAKVALITAYHDGLVARDEVASLEKQIDSSSLVSETAQDAALRKHGEIFRAQRQKRLFSSKDDLDQIQ